MSSIKRTQDLPTLDPKFIWLLNQLWKLVMFIFNGISFIVSQVIFHVKDKRELDADVKPKLNENIVRTKKKAPKERLTDEKVFLNLGSTRWISDLNPDELIEESAQSAPDVENLEIKYIKEKEEKKFVVSVFGKLFEEQLENIEKALCDFAKVKSLESLGLKQIHIIKDLGKFSSDDGNSTVNVPAFTINQYGAMLLHEKAALDRTRCKSLLEFALNDFENYQAIFKKAHSTLWNLPRSIGDRLKTHPEYTPPDSRNKYGTLREKFIIDQDTKIVGGVYLGHPAREALVASIDGLHIHQMYSKLVTDIRAQKEPLGIALEEKILSLVSQAVQKAIPRSTPEAMKSMRDSCRASADDELPIEACVRHESGEAEHQALIAALLLDQLKQDHSQYITGKVSLDRNWVPGGGHAWVRYTASPKDIYIIDPKKNFFARMDDYSKPRPWAYERAEDLKVNRGFRPIK